MATCVNSMMRGVGVDERTVGGDNRVQWWGGGWRKGRLRVKWRLRAMKMAVLVEVKKRVQSGNREFKTSNLMICSITCEAWAATKIISVGSATCEDLVIQKTLEHRIFLRMFSLLFTERHSSPVTYKLFLLEGGTWWNPVVVPSHVCSCPTAVFPVSKVRHTFFGHHRAAYIKAGGNNKKCVYGNTNW